MDAFLIRHVEPDSQHLFRVVTDSYGKRLALVFGNHAAGGQCPFVVASRCHHCDIGIGEGVQFDVATNRQRLAWYQAHFGDDWKTTAHLIVYNSGSVLNPAEMPFEFLEAILETARNQACVRVVSLDSRESFVTTERLCRIAARLREDQCARIIIGIESANDTIRNQILEKGMSRQGIQRAFDHLAAAAERIAPGRVGVDVNIVVAGPGTTSQTAVSDALETARFTLARCEIPVDFNIHPYYPSVRGRTRFPNHPRCSIPLLLEAVQAIAEECRSNGRGSRVFVGLNDEGHDTDPERRQDDLRGIGPIIEQFNATQVLKA
jgi:hypothetical protein